MMWRSEFTVAPVLSIRSHSPMTILRAPACISWSTVMRFHRYTLRLRSWRVKSCKWDRRSEWRVKLSLLMRYYSIMTNLCWWAHFSCVPRTALGKASTTAVIYLTKKATRKHFLKHNLYITRSGKLIRIYSYAHLLKRISTSVARAILEWKNPAGAISIFFFGSLADSFLNA